MIFGSLAPQVAGVGDLEGCRCEERKSLDEAIPN